MRAKNPKLPCFHLKSWLRVTRGVSRCFDRWRRLEFPVIIYGNGGSSAARLTPLRVTMETQKFRSKIFKKPTLQTWFTESLAPCVVIALEYCCFKSKKARKKIKSYKPFLVGFEKLKLENLNFIKNFFQTCIWKQTL